MSATRRNHYHGRECPSPAAMLITQVLLAQRLGVSGRGTVAAAHGPPDVCSRVPDARSPGGAHVLCREKGEARHARQLGASLTALAAAGTVGILAIFAFARSLSAGNSQLAESMIIASAALVPALGTAAMRGVAYGAHSWWLVMAERSCMRSALGLGLVPKSGSVRL